MDLADQKNHHGLWYGVWRRFSRHWLGKFALIVVLLFGVVALYAPFLASSKPLVVQYNGTWYFPLFRYLFFTEFFTKRLDIFYNLLMFTLPLAVLAFISFISKPKLRNSSLLLIFFVQMTLFVHYGFNTTKDPAVNVELNRSRQAAIQKELAQNGEFVSTWNFDLAYMTDYAKLNHVLRYQQRYLQHQRLIGFAKGYEIEAKHRWLDDAVRNAKTKWLREGKQLDKIPSDQILKEQILANTSPEIIANETAIPTLWQYEIDNDFEEIARQQQTILELKKEGHESKAALQEAEAKIAYIRDRRSWLDNQVKLLRYEVMPLLRPYHWEDDAGGEESLNRFLPWWELTRINHKDLTAALIFGTRISLVVGFIAVAISLAIGIPVGALAGYYGGKIDIVVYRLIEIWESMPVFFMLLMVVAMLQSKSIFLVIAVIGIFSWTGFSRYIRGEFFKQRNLPYVEACKALGYRDPFIIFSHILPNAIPPLLTLLPFAVMGAITSEAGLSFLGLGEEGSCSWGVLMDEGRNAFPGESYLLWPPAIMLTTLLIAIALVGDSLRDALDPKVAVS